MEVTWIGMILLPLGLLLAILSPKWLYNLTVFLIPFTATAVLNSGTYSSVFAVQYLGILWMLRYWADLLLVPELLIKREYFEPFWLWFFGLVVITSMIMPLLINGKDWVIIGDPIFSTESIPIELTWKTAKHPLQVIFGVFFATTIAMENATATKLRNTFRVYALSGVFFAAWGMLQFLCSNVLHLPYPSFVFNTSQLESAQNFVQMTADGINRISSASREPSMFAKQLLVNLSLLLYGIFTGTWLFSRCLDLFFMAIMVVMILLSTATSGYIGLPVVFGLSLTLFFLYNNAAKKYRKITTILIAVAGGSLVMYLFLPESTNSVLAETLFNKQESISMLIRLSSIEYAWTYFEKYPILGTGWNFVTSFDLIVCLLANAGIIGLFAFTIMAIRPLLRTMKLLRCLPQDQILNSNPIITYAIGSAIAQVLLFTLAILGGYEFYLVYSYMTLGLLYASNTQLSLIEAQ